MAAVVLEDFYRPFFNKPLSQRHTKILMKSTVILMGVVCVALVFVVEKLGAVLQVNTEGIGMFCNTAKAVIAHRCLGTLL